MTADEHKLIVAMLATQFGILRDLINELIANGTLRTGEQAQIYLSSHGTANPLKDRADVVLLYRTLAAKIGVEIPPEFE